MSAFQFFIQMRELHEAGHWKRVQRFLMVSHPLVPGEREVFIELQEHLRKLRVQLDESGLHVVPKVK